LRAIFIHLTLFKRFFEIPSRLQARALTGGILLARFSLILIVAMLGCAIPDESRWPSLVIVATPEAVVDLERCPLEEYKKMDGTLVRVVTIPASEFMARLEGGERADLSLVSSPALISGLAQKGLIAGKPWLFEFARAGPSVESSKTPNKPPMGYPRQISGAVLKCSRNPVAARRLWGFLEKSLRPEGGRR
jgi:hypothetical protein